MRSLDGAFFFGKNEVRGVPKQTGFAVERFSEDNRFFVPEQVSVLRSWAIDDDEADQR